MTVLVYAYKHAYDNGVELRHSLRSVDKHFHPIDGSLSVIITGDCPDWLDTDKAHFLKGNPSDNKIFNMAFNARVACEYLQGIGVEEFITCDDDYFLMSHQTDVPLVRNYRNLAEHAAKTARVEPGSWYDRAVHYTRDWVDRQDDTKNKWSWELHHPLRIDVRHAFPVLKDITRSPFPPLWRTAVGSKRVNEGWGSEDPWAMKGYRPWGLPWISLADGAWDHFGRQLARTFDTPSRWEKR